MTENEIGTIVMAAAIAVHRELGPGLLETVCRAAVGSARPRRRHSVHGGAQYTS